MVERLAQTLSTRRRAVAVVVAGLAVFVALLTLACARATTEPSPTQTSAGVSVAPSPDAAARPNPTPSQGPVASASPSDATRLGPEPVEPAPKQKLYIQPLGEELADLEVDFVKQSLLAFYDIDIHMLPRVALPKAAYYSKRKRYRAEKLLDTLQARLPKDGFRILGLTGVDISTTKEPHEDWGILGLATVDGVACVLSSFRTKRLAKSRDHAKVRLGKVAVHEIGHTLGLRHCPTEGCLMEDARGTVLTTDTEYDLCADSRQELIRRGHALADASIPIPWPKPEPR